MPIRHPSKGIGLGEWGWVSYPKRSHVGPPQLAGREGSSSEVYGSVTGGLCNKGVVETNEVRREASWFCLGKGVTRRVPATDCSRLNQTDQRG